MDVMLEAERLLRRLSVACSRSLGFPQTSQLPIRKVQETDHVSLLRLAHSET